MTSWSPSIPELQSEMDLIIDPGRVEERQAGCVLVWSLVITIITKQLRGIVHNSVSHV